jgi:hypothetical protein
MRILRAAIWTLALGLLTACATSAPPASRGVAARHGAMGIDAFGHTQLAPDCATLPPRARAHAERLIAILRRELPKYRDLTVARRDGFAPAGEDVPVGALKHWINPGNVRVGWQHLDPERPMALLYRNTGHGYELAGAMFSAPYASSPIDLNNRIPLALGHWHAHRNICQPRAGVHIERSELRRFGFSGSITSREDCAAAGGAFLDNVYGWMVHVYPFEPKLEEQFG